MTLLTPELLDTKTYGFEKLRYLLQSFALQEGVIDAADLKVVQRGAGANMSVDVGAGRAFIKADSGTRNGLYHEVNDAVINVAVTASHATLPRIDQVILEVRDSSDLGSGDDTPQLYVLAGTATGGAALDNRTGAAALPNNAIRLGDILVPAASVSVVTANIRDRRQWARGARRFIQRNANAAAGSDYTTTTSVDPKGAIDATNLSPRVELSGGLATLRLRGHAAVSVAARANDVEFQVDAVNVNGDNIQWPSLAANPTQFDMEVEYVPTPGSKLVTPKYRVAGGAATLTLSANATQPLQLIIEETVLGNADNS